MTRHPELGGHSTLAAREAELVSAIGSGRLQRGEVPIRGQAPELPSPYIALRLLGEGGMGQVWEGRHTGLDKPVAIKVLRTDQREGPLSLAEARARFARESRVAAAVHHENVVEISDVGETADGHPFQVMELLEGPTLKQLIVSEGALPWARARPILAQLADALAFAHRIGVIHRDLKPSNVVVIGRRNEPDYCKLIDFGLAKPLDLGGDTTTLTQSGKIFGSPAYMSPEQCRGEKAGPQSDLYALGCITFFVLCGRRPFVTSNLGQLIYQQQFERIDPREFLPDTPEREGIAQLIERCLDKDPQTRLASAETFARELEAVSTKVSTHRAVAVETSPAAKPEPGSATDSVPPVKTLPRVAVAVVLGAALLGGWALSSQRGESPSDPTRTEAAAETGADASESRPSAAGQAEAQVGNAELEPKTVRAPEAGVVTAPEAGAVKAQAEAPAKVQSEAQAKAQAKARSKSTTEAESRSAGESEPPEAQVEPSPAKVQPTGDNSPADESYVPDKPSDPFGSR